MLRHLYLDNFRGFSNILVPFLDVNFLVGENSAGKTSVLSAAKLLAAPDFWFNQDFAHEDIGFTQFSDIASVHSSDTAFFRLGLIEDRKKKDDNRQIVAHLFTFRERSGAPILSAYSHVINNRALTMKLDGDRVFFKLTKNQSNRASKTSNFKSQLFLELIKEHDHSTEGYRELEGASPRNFGNSSTAVPIPILMSIVTAQAEGRNFYKGPEPLFLSSPFFDGELVWIAPIRTKPRRTHDQLLTRFSPGGEHTPYLIKRLLDSEKEAKRVEAFFKK